MSVTREQSAYSAYVAYSNVKNEPVVTFDEFVNSTEWSAAWYAVYDLQKAA